MELTGLSQVLGVFGHLQLLWIIPDLRLSAYLAVVPGKHCGVNGTVTRLESIRPPSVIVDNT